MLRFICSQASTERSSAMRFSTSFGSKVGTAMPGELDPVVTLDVIGDAADAKGATQLAQMVQGLIAFGTMQAAQKPELKDLPNAFSVTTEPSRVLLSFPTTPAQ